MENALTDEKSPVERLKLFDDEKGRKLDYPETEKVLMPVVEKIVKEGEKHLDEIHALLNTDQTWSHVFALKAVDKIKSEKSILPLIEFIKMNDASDNLGSSETAFQMLGGMGSPAVEPLIEEVNSSFRRKEYFVGLFAALEAIEDERIRPFLLSVAEDFVGRPEDFRGWFKMDHFANCLSKNEKPEELALLRKIERTPYLSERDARQVECVIEDFEGTREKKHFIGGLEGMREARSVLSRLGDLSEAESFGFGSPEDLLEEERLARPERMKEAFGILGLSAERIDQLTDSMPAGRLRSITEDDWRRNAAILSEAAGHAEKNPDLLHALLTEDNPLVSVNILKVLGEFKRKKSIPFIIQAAKNTSEPSVSEEASGALMSIGDPALDLLIEEAKETFREKNPSLHLTTGIAKFDDPRVDSFERWAVEYCLSDPGEFEHFGIHEFVYLFRNRDNGDLAALLRSAETGSFSEKQVKDVRDAVEIAENPAAFERKFRGRPGEPRSKVISQLIRERENQEPEQRQKKTGRNEPCPCGSGKKYKKCCL